MNPETIDFAMGPVKTRLLELYVREGSESEREQLDIRIDTRFAFDAETEAVTTEITVRYLPILETEEPEPLLKLALESIVLTTGLTSYMKSNTVLPIQVQAPMLGIALGTARGCIRSSAAAFSVREVEMPVLDPVRLLEGNLTREALEG